MNKVLAVAVLDIRRLWMTAAGVGVALGIAPGLAQLGGGTALKAVNAFPFVFAVAATVAGTTFGSDFGEGKPSFFFARPLSTLALFGGRLAALLALAAAAYLGFSASYWLSGSQPLAESFMRISTVNLGTLATLWVVSLYFGLAVAAHTRQMVTNGLRGFVVGAARMAGVVVMTALTFGLFMDIVMRAYTSRTPLKLLIVFYGAAALVASWLAIEMGRTDRLRITRVLNVAMYVHAALALGVMSITWAYLLHPGPEAIRAVTAAFSSPDGRVAYVSTRVNRGNPDIFSPVFGVDLGSGEVRRLTASASIGGPNLPGLWHSRDGSTKVWSEQTPVAFRSARRLLTNHRRSGSKPRLEKRSRFRCRPVSISTGISAAFCRSRFCRRPTAISLRFVGPT